MTVQTETIEVSGIRCERCVLRLGKVLDGFDGLDQALDKAKSATQTYSDDVKAVGSPPVAESEAKKTLDTLKDELSKDADPKGTVESAFKNAPACKSLIGS